MNFELLALELAITAATNKLLACNFNVYIGVEGAAQRRVEVLAELTELVLAKMKMESIDLMPEPDYVGNPDPDHDEYGIGWEDLSDPVEGDYEF